MLLFPPIFHGILGFFLVSIIAMSLFLYPEVFAEEWEIKIANGASLETTEEVFVPNKLAFTEGDTITWVNDDSIKHHITSGMPNFPDYYGYFFDVGVTEPNKSSSIIISDDENEAYYYLCEIHPWMTGKLFLGNTITAQPETENPIFTNKQSFSKGELIMVKGSVHKDFWGSEYQLQVYDEKNNLIDISHGRFDDESNYEIKVDTNKFESSGKYKLNLIYALPSKVAQTSIEFVDAPIIDDPNIPSWVKNVSKLWCTNQINDSEFLGALEYMIENEIMSVDAKVKIYSEKKSIPNWVKSNTCWWSDSKISDIEFLSGIEYLINTGTIKA